MKLLRLLCLLTLGLWGGLAWSGETIRLIEAAQLPPEALQTLRRIESGGPFPYRRDGIVFRNFERLLPQQPLGYYREYTVPTPGIRHRGARRIVTGASGQRFYTDDHYRSFQQISTP
jgi:ribonuclease T1